MEDHSQGSRLGALYTGFLFFPLRCPTSSYRASSSLAWCCLRSRPLSLLESQFNESRGATPSLLPAQAEPDRVLYHRQSEPHATLLLSSGRVVPDPHPLLYVLFLSIASVLIASLDDPAAWLGVSLDSPSLSECVIYMARSSSSRSSHQRINQGKNKKETRKSQERERGSMSMREE